MTPRRRLHLLFAALIAASLAVPGVAAEEGRGTAQKVTYNGGAQVVGDLFAFYYSQPALAADGSPTVEIRIKADQIEALTIERHYLVGPDIMGFTQPIEDPRYSSGDPAPREMLAKAQAELVGHQDSFQVHVLPQTADGHVPFKATTEAGEFDAIPHLAMGGGNFGPALPNDIEDRDPDRAEFWTVLASEPLVAHDDQARVFTATFTGDCVLEVMGGTFDARDAGTKTTLESGVWNEPPADGLPVASPLQAQRVVMLRLFLVGATIEMSSQGGSPDIFFAAPSVASDQGGKSSLLGNTVDGAQDPGETLALDAGHTLALTPTRDGKQLDVAFGPTINPQTASANVLQLDGQPTLVVGIVAILALAAAVALGVLRPRSGPDDLRAVEAALEAQRYRRAARLAKRILRARPGSEDAVLGRAIALSKSGRAGAAIAEVHAHLATRGATDGSLHYVLGLAFLDVGRVEDARAALREAVRLTPALAADVAARLGPQASLAPAASPWEVHGYA